MELQKLLAKNFNILSWVDITSKKTWLVVLPNVDFFIEHQCTIDTFVHALNSEAVNRDTKGLSEYLGFDFIDINARFERQILENTWIPIVIANDLEQAIRCINERLLNHINDLDHWIKSVNIVSQKIEDVYHAESTLHPTDFKSIWSD